MQNRFVVLSLCTGVFQLICVITLAAGIFLIASGLSPQHGPVLVNNPFGAPPPNPFEQIPATTKVVAGALLSLYGLAGLVFSGGVSVLISMDGTLASVEQKLRSLGSIRLEPERITEASKTWPSEDVHASEKPLSSESEHSPTKSAVASVSSRICPACNAASEGDSHFCENCGTSLS